MNLFVEYVLSLTAAAMISGILLSVLPEGASRQVVRMACGIFLAVTALSPMTRFQLPDLDRMLQDQMNMAQAVAGRGEAMAETERLSLIKQGLEAYILDKAGALGIRITPEVALDTRGIPTKIRITGPVSEPERRQLEALIEEHLGIPKEDQQWTG